MFSRQFLSCFATSAGLLVVLTFIGCSADIEGDQQQAGQTCYVDADCAGDLICRQRVCVPTNVSHADGAGLGDAAVDTGSSDEDTDNQTDTEPDRDTAPSDDVGEDCGEPGTQECLGGPTFRVCQEDGEWLEQECGDNSVCTDGACQLKSVVCQDDDEDGYHVGCPVENPDCDDTDPNTNPGAREKCNNNFDDNCNGEVDENCQPCCPDGCADDEFCSDCSCQPYRAGTCTAQNQPCNTEGRDNGYYCSAEFARGKRCLGVCNTDADNPDATCPDSSSTCLFQLEENSGDGLCFNDCQLNQGCGLQDMGCLPYDGSQDTEGVCVPTNPRNQIGDDCEADATFACESGAICVGGGRGEPGQCRQACRPFADPDASDCDEGSYCLAMSDSLGICTPDNGHQQGDRCEQQSTTCGEDAVGCFGGRGGSARCYRLCRVSKGSEDCDSEGARCRRVQRDGDLGICVN